MKFLFIVKHFIIKIIWPHYFKTLLLLKYNFIGSHGRHLTRGQTHHYRSNYNSMTSKLNSSTQALDTKECVALESNNTYKLLPTKEHTLRIKLPDLTTSTPSKAYTLPTS